MGEFDPSLVRLEMREVPAESPRAAADSIGSDPALLLSREGSTPERRAGA
jgi:hypothetical protein